MPSEEDCIALRTISKQAKKYERRAESYSNVSQSQYDILMGKKRALYEVKHLVLQKWISETDKIEKHTINDSIYYCFYFGDYSFHIPEEKVSQNIEIDGRKEIEEFEKSPISDTGTTLREALQRVYENHQINANQHLQLTQSSDTNRAYWPWLPFPAFY